MGLETQGADRLAVHSISKFLDHAGEATTSMEANRSMADLLEGKQTAGSVQKVSMRKEQQEERRHGGNSKPDQGTTSDDDDRQQTACWACGSPYHIHGSDEGPAKGQPVQRQYQTRDKRRGPNRTSTNMFFLEKTRGHTRLPS